MEKLYRKLSNGKYEEVGYNLPDVPNGLFFSQKTKHGRRCTSINYWLGGIDTEPVDLKRLISTMSLDDDLADYINDLEDEHSDEFKKLKENNPNIKPLRLYNMSKMELAQLILRFLFTKMPN